MPSALLLCFYEAPGKAGAENTFMDFSYRFPQKKEPSGFHWEIRRFSFIVGKDHSWLRAIAICSGVMGSSRNHLPVAR